VTQADGGGPRHDAEFRRRLLYLVAAGLVGAVCTALRGGIFTYSMGLQNVRVRRWLFESLCRQDISFFDGTKVGDLLSRLTSDTTRISDSISLNINVLLRCIVSACIVLGFMMYVNGRLTLICLSAMPVVTVMAKYYGAYVKKLSKQTQEEVAASNVCAEEVLSNMRTVRSLNGEKQAAYEFEDRLNNYTSMNTRQSIAYSLLAFLYTLLPTLVTLLLLLEGGKLVMRNELSSGKLFTFMLYQVSLSSSFNVIADVFTSFSSALGSAQKVAELIDTDETEHLEGAFAPERVVGRLELRNVTFRYPTRREVAALDGLSVSIEAGKSLALVGPSGGGKSSCIQLIKRFYEPEYGAVMLDGKNLRSYSDKFVHEHIALVSQEPVLFNRSILDNILYGLKVGCDCDADGGGDGGEPSMPTMEDVHAAARLANAHDFIIGLPMGYATVCGDKGVSLSGGQKQRIAIARALVRKPTVLLLDEATSALDSESEHTVQKAIDRLMERSTCTVVLIAHRLSTVRNADQVRDSDLHILFSLLCDTLALESVPAKKLVLFMPTVSPCHRVTRHARSLTLRAGSATSRARPRSCWTSRGGCTRRS